MGKGKTAKHRSGKALRVEPSHHDIFDIYPEIGKNFKKAGWMQFIRILNGYHPQVAMVFAQSFNGYQAQVGGLTMYVSEGTIIETFKLDITGDHWFKKGKVYEALLNHFLLPEIQNPDWRKGIPLKFLQKEWQMILILVKNYISCEGRYSLIFRFHMNFLLHMTGDTQMNLPFFILKSLQKMSMKVQKFPKSVESSLAHPCLITVLVYHELSCYKIDKNIFLIDVGFNLRSELERQDKERRSRKKMQNIVNPTKESPMSKVTLTHGRMGKKWVNLPESKADTVGSEHSDTCVEYEETKPKPRITKARNKFRLNAKALLKPSLKSTTTVNIDSDTPGKPTPKKRVSFRIASEDPLFQLAQAAELVGKIESEMENGKRIKVTVKQGKGGRLRGQKSHIMPKRDDAKEKRGRKHSV